MKGVLKATDLPTGMIGPDVPDSRDKIKSVPETEPKPIDLTDIAPIEPTDQRRYSSCTGHAARKLAEYLVYRLTEKHVGYASNHYYWHARADKQKDQGAHMRAIALALKNHGSLPEYLWSDHEDPTRRPDDARDYDTETRGYKPPAVERVDGLRTLLRVLSHERLPVLSGIMLQRDSTEQMVQTGWAPDYDPDDPQTGGHAELICGWDTRNGKTYVKYAGSWDKSAGVGGFYWRPAEYVEKATLSLWTVARDFV